MKRVLLVGLALGASMLVGPVAQAANPDVIHGGCWFNTDEQATVTGGQNVGLIGDWSVTTTGDTPPVPIGAVVTCWIEVNGVVAPGTTHSYGDGTTAVQAGADPISFNAADTDVVEECYSVHYADGSAVDATCIYPNLLLPPQWVIDALNGAFGTISGVVQSDVDPVLCPVLMRLAGSYPGGVTIESDGDVIVPDPLGLGLNPVYDCPPYRFTP